MNGQETKLHNGNDNSRFLEDIRSAADHLLSKTKLRPKIAVICGTGLNHLSDILTDSVLIDYKDIPHFLIPSVQGHKGKVTIGLSEDVPVILLLGRVHVYEDCCLWKVTFAVRVMAEMGVEILVVTNAAGGLNDSFRVGDFMIIKDHVNLPGLTGLNPLAGLNDERFGPKFVDMSAPYDRELRQIGHRVASELNMDFIREGVHFVQIGPCYETTAECRMLKQLGADTIGMSTAPEVIVARQHKMRCFGLSMISNLSNLDFDTERGANHEEVLEAGTMRAEDIKRYCSALIKQFSQVLSPMNHN